MTQRMDAIITEIERHRAAFEAWCRSLTAEELERPVPGSTWQVRDFIAHLASIDRTVTEWFARLRAGDTGAGGRAQDDGKRFDVDAWNDAQVARRRGRSLDEIFAEAARNRAAIIEALRPFSDAQMDAVIVFGGDGKRAPSEVRFMDYLTGWAKHDPIHAADMLRALPERRVDARIRAWLGAPDIAPVVEQYERTMNRGA